MVKSITEKHCLGLLVICPIAIA